MLGVGDDVAGFIANHHAFYGRSGAADGRVVGQNTPLGARILAVADAFVTMTSDRCYQPKQSLSGAVGELRRHSGDQFDPAVVDAVSHVLTSETAVPMDRGLTAEPLLV